MGSASRRWTRLDRPNFPGVTANLAVSTRALWRPLLLSVRGAGTAARAKDPDALLPDQSRQTPASTSFAALAALEVPRVPGLTLELSLLNALDAQNATPVPGDYAPISQLPGPKRTLRADVRWSF